MAGAEHGQYVSPDAFKEMIHAMGRTPAQRNTLYEILRTFPRPGHPAVEAAAAGAGHERTTDSPVAEAP
jgi:hypothetical protein